MKFYKFYKPHPKSQSACLWFCSMNALTSYKSHPKSQMPVFDFVAWVCVQVSQVSPRCPKWPVFDFVAWIPLQDFTNQLKVSKMTGLWFCSMFSLDRNPKLVAQNQEPMHVGATGVSGELSFTESRLFPLTISHHYRIKIWWVQRKMVLWKWYCYRIKPEFYNILHLISLYKIKDPYMLGKKGFRGTILYRIKFIPSYYLKTTTESRSEDLTLRGMLY